MRGAGPATARSRLSACCRGRQRGGRDRSPGPSISRTSPWQSGPAGRGPAGRATVAPPCCTTAPTAAASKNIRYAQFRPGVVRVVIDLDALKDYQVERRDGRCGSRSGSERTHSKPGSTSRRRARAAAPLSLRCTGAQRPAARSGGGGPGGAGGDPGADRRRRHRRVLSRRTRRRARSRRRRASR